MVNLVWYFLTAPVFDYLPCAGKEEIFVKTEKEKTKINDISRPNAPTAQKKKRLIRILCLAAGVLAVLFILAEFLLPHIAARTDGKNSPSASQNEVTTRYFYDDRFLTDEDLAEYETFNRDVSFKNPQGVETLVTDSDYVSAGGEEAVLFGKYIDAIKNGDSAAYAACFSEEYDFENGLDRFARGDETFPPQRLYDIRIEALDTLSDEQSGITQSLYDVRYRIYKNTGDFRSDMTDDTAPLLFVVETKNGETRITDIAYRYGGN